MTHESLKQASEAATALGQSWLLIGLRLQQAHQGKKPYQEVADVCVDESVKRRALAEKFNEALEATGEENHV